MNLKIIQRWHVALSLLIVSPTLAWADEPGALATENERANRAVTEALQWIRAPATRREVASANAAIRLEHLTYDQMRPLRLWIATIDASHPDVSFVVTEPNPRADKDGRQFETLCETTLAFAQRTGVQLAINTSAFGPGRGSPLQPMDVAGLAAHEGRVFSRPVKNYGAMYIDKNGRIRLKAPPLEENGVWSVVAGFRMLLDDGRPVVADDVFATSFGNINPRTAVGTDKHGRTLWIVVADGRQRTRSLGLTLPELAAVFQWLGAWDALNLDGGGSSTLVMQDETGGPRVVNEPINGGQVGVLRQVANNLGVRIKDPQIRWQRADAVDLVAPELSAYELSPQAQQLRLPHDVKVDAALQAFLERLDESIAGELNIPADRRALGVVDLRSARVAMINGDAMFYGASVPKIAIVLEYLRQHPEFVAAPDPTVMRELQRVIKRSDNELAAKYARLAGLDNIQQMLQSDDYQLYDKDHGGGLWCGKYYGSPTPRKGDPLKDLSHAATVRQCLRWYLMLEQDRLGSPALCSRLREILTAPWLDFHDDNFVAGLKGMSLTLIRKNGLWEDWHLDTARVALSDGPVLLAGIVHHAEGSAYLRRMARGLISEMSQQDKAHEQRPWRGFRHATFQVQGGDLGAWQELGVERHAEQPINVGAQTIVLDEKGRASLQTAILTAPFKSNEALVSWNIDVPADISYAIDLSVGRRFENEWSPWLPVDQRGPRPVNMTPSKRFDGGKVDIDYFVGDQRFDQSRVRVRILGAPGQQISVKIHRLDVTVSDTTRMADSWRPTISLVAKPPKAAYSKRLPVPFRSQYTGQPDLRGRICSPASLSMVLAYHGKDLPTTKVVKACHDPVNDIYGNWPRNIAAAYELGVSGYLTRINDWAVVQKYIAAGQPLVASIRFDRPKLIEAAPYNMTDGHLLVICGFDKDGNVHVNDSAVAKPEEGQRVYNRDQLEAAWFGGSGGVTYVLRANE